MGAFGSLNSLQLLCLDLPVYLDQPAEELELNRPRAYRAAVHGVSVRALAIVISTIAWGDSLCGLRLLL